jgi:hypothetical protein
VDREVRYEVANRGEDRYVRANPTTLSRSEALRIRNGGIALLAAFAIVAGAVGLVTHSVLAFIFTLTGAGVFSLVLLLPIGVIVGARIDAKRAAAGSQPPATD